jgi:large subunit ribosomal protein L3
MTPGRVKLGMKMPGHMGDATTSVLNQKVAKVVADQNLILIRGGIPGSRGGLVVVRGAIKKKNAGKKKA